MVYSRSSRRPTCATGSTNLLVRACCFSPKTNTPSSISTMVPGKSCAASVRFACCKWFVARKASVPPGQKTKKSPGKGVDRTLFEVLRKLRRDLASERAVPPYVVFHDGVLREMARVFPSSPERFRRLSGVGEARLRDYGAPIPRSHPGTLHQ